MTQTRQRIDFINTTYDEVERELLAGKPPREVAELLAEPIPNVMGVWSDLRNAGKVQPQNFPAGAARPAPQNIGGPPRHVPDPELSSRIAGPTDLLVRAARIEDRRIQSALGRARKAMTDLAGLVEKHESKASTRSEIAKLEAQIRVLKAELTGKAPAPAPAAGGGSGRGQAPADRRATRAPGQDARADHAARRLPEVRPHLRVEGGTRQPRTQLHRQGCLAK